MSPSSIIIGLSGGVDSAVSAYLLKQAGHEVTAVFMQNWQEETPDAHCPIAQDLDDAQTVCDELGIPLKTINFADEYWQRVFTFFLEEYAQGRTPNPDVLCNKEIKFRAFLDYAKNQGADYIATGHYARTTKDQRAVHLYKGIDPGKDQSYFLHALDQEQLSSVLFPVGHLHKQQVRAIAQQIGLKNQAKKDSTGICFIGERKFKTFLNEYLPARPGKIETLEGEVIGEHTGLMYHTIGQRQGLGIGGKQSKQELPWYVAAKDIARNVLIVVQGHHHPALFKSTLTAAKIHWIGSSTVPLTSLKAKIRYRQADQVCSLCKLDDQRWKIDFQEPQRAVTPGQYIVFYQDEICLGGGIIEC